MKNQYWKKIDPKDFILFSLPDGVEEFARLEIKGRNQRWDDSTFYIGTNNGLYRVWFSGNKPSISLVDAEGQRVTEVFLHPKDKEKIVIKVDDEYLVNEIWVLSGMC